MNNTPPPPGFVLVGHSRSADGRATRIYRAQRITCDRCQQPITETQAFSGVYGRTWHDQCPSAAPEFPKVVGNALILADGSARQLRLLDRLYLACGIVTAQQLQEREQNATNTNPGEPTP